VLESLTKAAQFDEQTQEISLQNSARQAQAQLAALRNNIAEIPIQLAAATDTYRQKLAQYRAGIINIVDLTNAAFVLYRSKTDYAETMGDWYLGQLQLAYANGSLYDFIKNIQ
ncbi:MAG: TolC family protein, partial [Bacteroidota bacterium]|nr:TolC family protein [Bacteroidota bacterium]